MNNNVIIRNCFDENLTPIKIEYFNPMDGRRVVSQPYRPPVTQSASPSTGNYNVSMNFPQIAIKREEIKKESREEVVLVNGCWDTTNKIPNIVAEMHVNTKEVDISMKSEDLLSESPRDVTIPSPRGSDSGIESDCTEGNLSWLLNYKIRELPPVPDVSGVEHLNHNHHRIHQDNLNEISSFRSRIVHQVPNVIKTCEIRNHPDSFKYSELKKPPFTYTELIEYALSERGELTVSGIYQWISDHFPYYKQNDDRWKNSVRHNLSINPHFRKGAKAVQGAGHLWTIAQRDEKKCSQIKQRISQFFQYPYNEVNKPQDNIEKELQAATESILGEIHGQNYTIDTSRGTNIEVEYINLADPNNGLEDFLAPPVSKQDIVNECGLGNDIFITDINPNTLGLNLAEAEGMAADHYEDVFEYYTAKE